MLRFITWDVWAAVAFAAAVCLVELFDPAPAIFIVLYLGLCTYIAGQTIGNELD